MDGLTIKEANTGARFFAAGKVFLRVFGTPAVAEAAIRLQNRSKSIVIVGTRGANCVGVVKGLRARITALALVAGLFASAGASLFAQDRHPVCAARQHDCAKTTTIASCCCGDAGAPRDAGAPAQSRVEIAPAISATPALPQLVDLTRSEHPARPVQTSPPGMSVVDLTTLFATLLI